MPKRFTAAELDEGFAPACGFTGEDRAGAASPAPRARRMVAVLAAAIGLAGMGAVLAKQVVQAIAAAPADETAAWALMLVGLGMVGVAARRQISAEFTATTRR